MHTTPNKRRALEGVRVLDLSRLLPGPFASLVLADLGAQVDKVEDPNGGDYLRHMPPQIGGGVSTENAAFLALNRGKRSIVLDLKQPAGVHTLERLLANYDVLLESFRPGVLDRLGLSHTSLRARYPKLIIAAITGYGQTGPLAKRAGHDINYLARAGLLGLTGPSYGPPQIPGFQLADVGGAMWAVIGILAALRARDESGAGSLVDIAMHEAAMPFAIAELAALATTHPLERGNEPLTGGIAPFGTYQTSDHRFVALAALEPKFWTAFCEGVGLQPDLSALLPGEHQEAWKQKLAAIFAQRTRDSWTAFGAERDCCLEPVLDPSELRQDPQMVARSVFLEQTTPFGPSVQLRLPGVDIDPTTISVAPRVGEHSVDILQEAGLSPDEVSNLVANKIVSCLS